jgi:hypothetical protein
MALTVLLSRVVLAGVFFWAGLSKCLAFTLWKDSVRDFGVPRSLAGPVAVMLPLTEMVLAGMLLTRAYAHWAAIGCILLLFTFVCAISLMLATGRRPDCRCFGQLRSTPVGWRTLLRNVSLAALAAFALWLDSHGAGLGGVVPVPDVKGTQVIAALVGVAMVAHGWFTIQLFLQNGRLLLRMDALESSLIQDGTNPSYPSHVGSNDLPLGTLAPPFRLSDLEGRLTTLDDLLAHNRPVMLLFVDPSCGPCKDLLPLLAAWRPEGEDASTICLISRGSKEQNRRELGESYRVRILLQIKGEVAEAYRVYGTPGAVLVNDDGTVGSSVVMGAGAILRELERTNGISQDRTAALLP